MIAMLVLWTGLSQVISWWNTTWDDLHSGRPRTFQIDVVVGQNDSPSYDSASSRHASDLQNENGGFCPATSSEIQTVEHSLQQRRQ
jgi:hypothetical protein